MTGLLAEGDHRALHAAHAELRALLVRRTLRAADLRGSKLSVASRSYPATPRAFHRSEFGYE